MKISVKGIPSYTFISTYILIQRSFLKMIYQINELLVMIGLEVQWTNHVYRRKYKLIAEYFEGMLIAHVMNT